jgi:hypothetical protein
MQNCPGNIRSSVMRLGETNKRAAHKRWRLGSVLLGTGSLVQLED